MAHRSLSDRSDWALGRLRRGPGPAGRRIGIHSNRRGVESRRDPQQGDDDHDERDAAAERRKDLR
jgi:hypothetical protein